MLGRIRARAALLTLAILVCGVLFPPRLSSGAPADSLQREGILRLHILANSDSAEDQRVKLAVRDAILEKLPSPDSAADAEAYLMTHGAELLATAEQVLRENGKPYSVQLMLGEFDFPDRQYGDTVYPAGRYRALRVLLGRAEGANWWCVLFPPLCIVTAEAEPLPKAEDIELESTLWNWVKGLGKED